jgi:hypothetical protein
VAAQRFSPFACAGRGGAVLSSGALGADPGSCKVVFVPAGRGEEEPVLLRLGAWLGRRGGGRAGGWACKPWGGSLSRLQVVVGWGLGWGRRGRWRGHFAGRRYIDLGGAEGVCSEGRGRTGKAHLVRGDGARRKGAGG